MKSTIILASYIPTNEKDELGNRYAIKIKVHNNILENIMKYLPHKNSMVFVVNDPDNIEENDDKARVNFESFKMSGVEFDNYIVLDKRNKNNTDEIIKNASLIVLSGGKIPAQNEFLHEIKLGDSIARSSAVVVGVSAGAMNLCEDVFNFPEELTDISDDRLMKGLGFFDKYIITHFDCENMQY